MLSHSDYSVSGTSVRVTWVVVVVGEERAIDGFFPSRETQGKRLFSRALRFSRRHDIRGAIVYFLIFLLFAFRRFKSARL